MKAYTAKAPFLLLNAMAASCVLFSCCGGPFQEHDSPDLTDTEKRAVIDRMLAEYRKDYEGVPELSVSELVSRMKTGEVVLVDVRTQPEQAVSMIPGAIPHTEFEARKNEYSDKTIVAYCTIGSRSGKYAATLRKESLDACNLEGSILAWAHAGRSLIDSEGAETRRVHVYGPKWNLLPKGYIPIW